MRVRIDISVFGILGIIFIVLKSIGVIRWSWALVIAPIWIEMLITFILLIFGGEDEDE